MTTDICATLIRFAQARGYMTPAQVSTARAACLHCGSWQAAADTLVARGVLTQSQASEVLAHCRKSDPLDEYFTRAAVAVERALVSAQRVHAVAQRGR